MRILPLLCLLPGACALPALAARPFVTDDARLTAAGGCQLESWMRASPDSRELWVLPACNPTGNLEISLGGGTARQDDGRATRDDVLQFKTLFRPLETNDWGWGLTVGAVRHPGGDPGPNRLGNTYFYVPFSASFDNDRTVLHANLGGLRDRASGKRAATWGVGGEFQVSPRLTAIAETFGDGGDSGRPYWQLGGRFALVPERVQIDATVGRRFAGPAGERWLSLGLRLTPAGGF